MKQVKFVGNEQALGKLQALLPAAKVVWLNGPAGVGKFLAAEQFALLVADPGDCLSHRGALDVDYVREIIQQAYFRPSGTKGRAFILECEKFSSEALNAMLKVLEEPPVNTHFFLVSSVDLPATVVSRCQRVAFRSMTKPEVITALVQEGWTFVNAERYANAGSVGQAIEEFSYEEARANVQTFLEACHNQNWEAISRGSGKWGSLELRFLRERMFLMAQGDRKKRPELFVLADWLGDPISCPTHTLLLAARYIIDKKIV